MKSIPPRCARPSLHRAKKACPPRGSHRDPMPACAPLKFENFRTGGFERVSGDVCFGPNFVCLPPSSGLGRHPRRTSQVVKGCRTPAVTGRLPRTRSAGVRQASGEETAGGIRRGGAAGSVYGDLTAAGWLAGVGWSAGSRGSGQPRQRRGGFATTLRWRWRVLLAELGARGGLEPSGAVAGFGGRHAWRFWGGVMVTIFRPCSVAGRAAGVRVRRSR